MTEAADIRTCSIGYCNNKHTARGWCRNHYQAWRKHGDPEGGQKRRRYEWPRSSNVACREWMGPRSTLLGYGRLYREGRVWFVHRWVWTLANGPIPDGLHVLHRCDNPPCFLLEHLYLGTPDDNMADKLRRGRNPGARLTEDEVRYIRQRRSAGVLGTELARELGVGTSTVYAVINDKSWRHVQ